MVDEAHYNFKAMEWERLAEAKEGEIVEIKGFVYPHRSGWMLTNQSGLKSCCVGSADKQRTQLYLSGDFSTFSQHIPVKMRGVFTVSSSGAYALGDVELLKEKGYPLWTWGLLIICALVLGFKLKRLLLP